ncbi:MAG: protein BatD [Elusimicrobia bacterium]|nr:protein BatD [Elusimicrobiota bacterium]
MNKIKFLKSFLIAIFFLLTTVLYADNIQMNSSVNRTEVALNETLQLTISISGDSRKLPEFSLPTLSDFNIYGTSQSKSFSMVNGNVTNTVSYVYTLSPKKTGEYNIPSFSLTYDGQTYETTPVKITVTDAKTVSSVSVQNTQIPPQKQTSQVYNFDTSKAIFVQAKTNKKSAYINEKIVYTFSFYTSVNILSNPAYQGPNFSGFFTGNTTQNNYRTQLNGREYIVNEVSTELYPQQAGNITIEPAKIMVSIEDFSKNYDDFFSSFFRRSKNIELTTDKINIKVSPVPENIDMVGTFKMTATVDKKDKKENEPFDLKVIISGTGNVKTIKEPEISLSDNLKKYETSEKILKSGDKETGKEFTTLIMPLSAGEGTIKILPQKYFDLSTKTIKYIPEKNIKVNIIEDKDKQNQAPVIGSATAQQNSYNHFGNQQPNIDFTFIFKIYNFLKKPILWIILGSLLILYILIRLVLKFVEYKNKDQQKLKNKKAYKKAKKYFQKAKKTKDAKEFYEFMYKGILEYFASVLGKSADGLTAYQIRKDLEERNVSAELIKQIEDIIDECSIILYSQSSVSSSENLTEFYNKTFDVMKKLDL